MTDPRAIATQISNHLPDLATCRNSFRGRKAYNIILRQMITILETELADKRTKKLKPE